MTKILLPQVSVGEDVYSSIKDVAFRYGKSCALVYGQKAYAACSEKLLKGIKEANLEILKEHHYGHEATFENIDKIINDPLIQQADIIFAIGGGKCIDTAKCAAVKMNKPIFTIPTIASTCAAVTKLSVLYNENGSFKEIANYDRIPDYCFIDTEVITKSPDKYLWAGIGDTLAKYIECTFSARNDKLDFVVEYGVNTSRLCFYPIIKDGKKAMEDKKQQVCSEELENVILNIIVSTGIVSICVGKDYNSALAHALNYGLSNRKHIEENHLHGEVVSYGALVQLVMDNQDEDYEMAYKFYKEIGLPTRLSDLELSLEDPMDDVLDITVVNNELEHVPYPVTKELIRAAINKLEELQNN